MLHQRKFFGNYLIKSRFIILLRLNSSWGIKRKNDFVNKRKVRYQEYNSFGKAILKGANSSAPTSCVVFKIMDYNILSHTHMLTHIQNYKKCPRQSLNWNYRNAVLKDEFLEANPDILCLQEVEEEHKNELLEPLRKLGLNGLYVARGEDKPDGCAILYKTSMFRVAGFSPVYFLRPDIPLLNRPNVGMVLKLELRNHPGNYMVIANTHLLYNPRRVDIKLCQLIMLLAETERLAFNNVGNTIKYHPVILTGDLNVGADSSLISLLSEGVLDPSKTTKTQEGSQLKELSFPTELLQQALHISESCQYIDVVDARKNGLDDPRATKDLQELLSVHRIYPEFTETMESQVLSKEVKDSLAESRREALIEQNIKQSTPKKSVSSSCLSHSFPFLNVHSHPEIDNSGPKHKHSTEKKLNIYDYMFYSCDPDYRSRSVEPKLRPGDLQLLSRLRLPSVSEYHSHIQCLPNYACGSDHLPLTATFLLPVR